MDEPEEEVDWEENEQGVSEGVWEAVAGAEAQESGRKRSQRRIRREDREKALYLHKNELLACMHRAASVNDWTKDELVQAAVMSVTPLFLLQSTRESGEEHIRDMFAWFRTNFSVISNCSVTAEEGRDGSPPEELLMTMAKKAGSVHQLNQIFVALLRLCGFRTRYVCTLDPPGKHPRNFPMHRLEGEESSEGTRVDVKQKQQRETIVSTWAEVLINTSKPVPMTPSSGPPSERKFGDSEVIDLSEDSEITNHCRWVHVDFNKALIDEPSGVEQRRKKAVMYVVGFSESGDAVDVTARYSNQYSLSLRDRLSPEDPFFVKVMRHWAAIKAFKLFSVEVIENSDLDMGRANALDASILRAENEELSRRIASEPIPSTIGAFQDHKMYVLERHLKKNEVIHPELKKVVGAIKGEGVYLREHVSLLRSKTQWRKEFRRIKHGEEPYRLLERKKDDRATNLGLFGEWQTESFEPPEVISGILPMNKYNNIEIWDGDERYVPKGAVLLREKYAIQCAKQLGIQHVPAGVISFGFNAVVFDIF